MDPDFRNRGVVHGHSPSVRLALLGVATFVVTTNSLNIAGLLPNIAEGLDVSIGSVSYGITAYALVAAIASPLFASVFSRRSRTAVLTTGLVVVAVGTSVAAVAPTLAWFIGGRALSALGAAAVVPVAMAVAPELVAPERRGRALAAVGVGFTAATALGAPIATALAALTDWRVSMGIVAGLAALVSFAMMGFVRDLPIGHVPGGRALLTVFSNPLLLIALVGNVLVVLAMEIVYIFGAEVSGRTGTPLAILLLLIGIAGIAGTLAGGRLDDRWGHGPVGLFGTAVLACTLLFLTSAGNSYALAAVGFAAYGVASCLVVIPRQHQLISIAPQVATVSLSWFSTTNYVGIALAPLIGAQLVHDGGSAIALGGATIACLAFVLFALGLRVQRRTAHPTSVAATLADAGSRGARTLE
ncbi:MFS transporter [Rhodococcus sp. NPDC047139]|uniref:MFS transporter n=1 Tax=Rhodococcus sp. NPDC047139 TaxID=3155141 RepID=UPI00340CECA2